MLANQNKFDEALYNLTCVPVVSKECFNTAQKQIGIIYKQKMNRDCDMLLTRATIAWNVGQDYDSAENTGFYLNQIEPDSKCYSKVKSLAKDIQKGVRENSNREWDFLENQPKNLAEIEKNRLITSREIAIAYANKLERIYNIKGWW